eukprot:jgi/Chlat1/2928/Chrsp2S04672
MEGIKVTVAIEAAAASRDVPPFRRPHVDHGYQMMARHHQAVRGECERERAEDGVEVLRWSAERKDDTRHSSNPIASRQPPKHLFVLPGAMIALRRAPLARVAPEAKHAQQEGDLKQEKHKPVFAVKGRVRGYVSPCLRVAQGVAKGQLEDPRDERQAQQASPSERGSRRQLGELQNTQVVRGRVCLLRPPARGGEGTRR